MLNCEADERMDFEQIPSHPGFAVYRAPTCHVLAPRHKCVRNSNHESSCLAVSPVFADDGRERRLVQIFMQEVPDEILDLILVFAVRGHRDMRTLSLTCKRWRTFAAQDQAWRRLTVRGWGNRGDIVQIPIEKDPAVSWYKYYENRILSHLPGLCYLRRQQQLTVSIRSILVNWLLAVVDEFQQEDEMMILPSAHHQTVSLLDHFCSQVDQSLQTCELQKIGAACAVMALHSGREIDEISLTCFKKASFYTDGCCTAEEILIASRKVQEALQISKIPVYETACHQIDVLLSAMQKNYPQSSTYCLSHYLGELALQAETSLKFRWTIVGSSAYALACHTLGWAESIWMPIIKSRSDVVSLSQLQPCMSELQALLRQALEMLSRKNKKGNFPHVIVKYSRRERQHVAKVVLSSTPWPTSCPHGKSREAAEPCSQCCAETDEEESSFHSDVIVSEETMDANLRAMDLAADSEYLPHMEAGMSTIDVETSREDVQTPVNAAQGGSTMFQRVAGKQGVAQAAQLADVHGNRSLQDVSFGAISDGNDNSFVVCPDVAFDDEHTTSASDRRASLDAVDEEEPDRYLAGAAPSSVNAAQVIQDSDEFLPDRSLDGGDLMPASTNVLGDDEPTLRRIACRCVADPDLAQLNIL